MKLIEARSRANDLNGDLIQSPACNDSYLRSGETGNGREPFSSDRGVAGAAAMQNPVDLTVLLQRAYRIGK